MGAKIVKVSFLHHDSRGGAHVSVSSPVFLHCLNVYADNVNDLPQDGVNAVCVDIDSRRVVTASGYTPDRGIFVESY